MTYTEPPRCPPLQTVINIQYPFKKSHIKSTLFCRYYFIIIVIIDSFSKCWFDAIICQDFFLIPQAGEGCLASLLWLGAGRGEYLLIIILLEIVVCLFKLRALFIICEQFDKIDGFVKICGRTRYLVLFGGEKYDSMRYPISVKSGITYLISHNFAKIKVGSYDSLPVERAMTFHNVLRFIKSLFNDDKNNCYYNTFLEKNS